MESQWTVEANGTKFGPFTTEQLLTLAQSGQIKPFYMVRKDGGPLVACAEVKGLFDGTSSAGGKSHGTKSHGATRSEGLTGGAHSDRESRRAQASPPAAAKSNAPPARLPVASASGVHAAELLAVPVALAAVPPPLPVATADTMQAHPVDTSAATHRRRASPQLLMTAAAILVGAAAAVVIYINLEPLEKRILRSGKAEAEVALAAPAPVAPPVAASAPAIAAPPNDAPPIDGGAAPAGNEPANQAEPPAGADPFAPNPADANEPNQPPPALAVQKSVSDARPSIVQLRTAMGAAMGPATRSVASGFVVDAQGTIATSLSGYRPGTPLQAVFHDGSTSEVIGYVAVAAERDLVLLKTTKVDTIPLVDAPTEVAPGTSVFAAGAGTTGGAVSLAPSAIDVARPLDTPMQYSNGATYLAAGMLVATLRDRVSSSLRGGPVLNNQGELAGMLSIAANGEQYVIDRRHVAELKPAEGDLVLALAELDAVRAQLGNTTGVMPAGGPGRQFAGGPGRPVPGGGQFPGAPGGRVVVNVGPQQPFQPARPMVGEPGSWLNMLDSVYYRRGSLISTRDDIQAALKPLLAEANRLDQKFRELDRQARSVRARYSNVEGQIATLQRRRLVETDTYAIDNSLYYARRELSNLRYTYEQLDRDAAGLRSQFNAMKPQIDAENARMAAVYADANLLRREFLKLLDPFGSPSKERGESGVKYFTDKIPMERDSSFAFFGRGCSHLSQGEIKLALADLDEAVKGAPKESIFLTVRGVAQFRNGDAAAARKDLNEAIRYDDKNYWCRFQYCLVLCRTEGFSIIEQQLKECMKLDPQAPDAFTMMAMLKATGDDKVRHADYAMRMAQSAYDLSATKAWDVTMALAAAHAEKGDFDLAVEFAEKAVAAATERQAAWCRESLATFQAKKPLRIDWKTFDFWALL